jgi:hypothetical protein
MNDIELNPEIHWMLNMAQELRDEKPLSQSSKPAQLDPDLAHPAMSVLCDLIDRCGDDVQSEFLRGYAFGLQQAGLIDDVVLTGVEMHIGIVDDSNITPEEKSNFN